MNLVPKREIERIVENDQVVSIIPPEKAGVGQVFFVFFFNKVITKEVCGYPE